MGEVESFDVISAEWKVLSIAGKPVAGDTQGIGADPGSSITFEANVEVYVWEGGVYTGFLWFFGVGATGSETRDWREGTSPGAFTVTVPSIIPPDPDLPQCGVFLSACPSEPSDPSSGCDRLLECQIWVGLYCDPNPTIGSGYLRGPGVCETDKARVGSMDCMPALLTEGR